MHHDDDVRARLQRQPVAGFLVAAVTRVAFMDMDPHAQQRRRHRHGVITAAVIHQDDFVHDALLEDFVHGLGDGFGRVVSRHDHDDFFSKIHGPKFWLILPESFQVLKPNLKSRHSAAEEDRPR